MEGYYVVRCDRSGVFAGNIKERNGREVTMTNCRRLYFWQGATCCMQLAKTGPQKPKECKFTVTVDEILLLDAIEINRCTEEAEAAIKGVATWKM